MSKRKIIVIGGGAAGLMAAGQAGESGADVLLLEKMRQPGLKLSITGKGRCNLSNTAKLIDFINHFGKSGRFLYQAFSHFFTNELVDFFEKRGLELATERGGRIFPASGKAQDVLEIFLKWTDQCGVKKKYSSPVEDLIINEEQIKGVISQGKKIFCDAVILATGGASYPATGSTGDGYRLAKSAGHSIELVRPALVPLETFGDTAQKMAGLSLRNVGLAMLLNGKKYKKDFGEMEFTKFGVSGPVILTLSGYAVDAMRDGGKITLSIDLKPALDEKKLDARLLRDFAARSKEPLSSVMRGLLPQEMVPVCLELTKISPDKSAGTITAKERRQLKTWLKDFRLEVSGSRPLSEAIITAGGVNTREIDPNKMESRLIKRLFIVGEVLDIQADTGGYNLQAAFSTGWLAGRSAALG